MPFDHGCSWITSANINPYRALASKYGFEVLNHSSNADEALYVDGRAATAVEWDQYRSGYVAVEAALGQAGSEGLDVAASSVMPSMPFAGTAQTWIGPMDMGVDFKDLSTRDYYNGAPTSPSYLIKEGFGALVARFGSELPAKLNTPVTRIAWDGDGVPIWYPKRCRPRPAFFSAGRLVSI